MNLEHLLSPRSVAIVGASADPRKISGMILDFLLRSGYAGKIYPVNPRHPGGGDIPWYASIDELPETVDLVVCVVPVAIAFEPIEAAARRGVPFCLLMTGGFGEGRTGEVGQQRLDRLMAVCAETGMQVVGPNTVGMVNFRQRLPLTFADWYARDNGCRDGVAIVTHSGSVGGLVFSSLQQKNIGVDYWIGLGNEAKLDAADFIEHFTRHSDVHTVVCYLEGVNDGPKFMAAAREARAQGKRVVVLTAGGSPESARSTRSHTGKNPSDADIYRGVFRQCGVIQVHSLAELTCVMVLLQTNGSKLGPRVGIMSASGGACSLIADHVADAGLQLPELDDALQADLNLSIPEYGSSRNPVDLSADVIARPDILRGTLGRLRDDRSIDTWIAFGRPLVDRYHEELARFAAETEAAFIVSCSVPVPPSIEAELKGKGLAVLDDPALCLRAVACILDARPRTAATRHLQETASARSVAVEAWVDKDFGPVISLAPSASGADRREARVVRALPLAPGDALQALLEHGAHPNDAGVTAFENLAARCASNGSLPSSSAMSIDVEGSITVKGEPNAA